MLLPPDIVTRMLVHSPGERLDFIIGLVRYPSTFSKAMSDVCTAINSTVAAFRLHVRETVVAEKD